MHDDQSSLLFVLESRFRSRMERHAHIAWEDVLRRLVSQPEKIRALGEMERTGGEPDVIGYDDKKDAYLFVDCSAQSPQGRRSLCFDDEALRSRKRNPPLGSACGEAGRMGVELLDEAQYRLLQRSGPYDTTTSSWIRTPDSIRKLGGALFCDHRYGTVFVYHNGADSYYGARGFRAILYV
jgi:hypothetical protein